MQKATKAIRVVCQRGKGTLEGRGPNAPDNRPYEDRIETLGALTRPVQVYNKEMGGWTDHPTETEVIFGICTEDGYMTQMAYSDRYGPTWTGELNSCREQGLDYWYFDAGGNGRPVRISLESLEIALQVLGLIEGEWV